MTINITLESHCDEATVAKFMASVGGGRIEDYLALRVEELLVGYCAPFVTGTATSTSKEVAEKWDSLAKAEQDKILAALATAAAVTP